jgi:hypothetical protein
MREMRGGKVERITNKETRKSMKKKGREKDVQRARKTEKKLE